MGVLDLIHGLLVLTRDHDRVDGRGSSRFWGCINVNGSGSAGLHMPVSMPIGMPVLDVGMPA